MTLWQLPAIDAAVPGRRAAPQRTLLSSKIIIFQKSIEIIYIIYIAIIIIQLLTFKTILFTVRVWAAQNRIEADGGGRVCGDGCPTCAAAT